MKPKNQKIFFSDMTQINRESYGFAITFTKDEIWTKDLTHVIDGVGWVGFQFVILFQFVIYDSNSKFVKVITKPENTKNKRQLVS